ncbi:MAG: threonine synthase [Bacteroidota bacterium]
MIYYNISNPAEKADFRKATLEGQPAGGGLYFPSYVPKWNEDFTRTLPNKSKTEIGTYIMQPYVGNCLKEETLYEIIEKVLSFEFPLKKINDYTWCLELFHGPTLAFKDLGARFLSRVMGHFALAGEQKIIVLVATSGDTGGAVADAFYGVEGTDVVILYPSGKVSPVQEKQLTTHGGNIHALEVQGDFDDCQRMVKEAFRDEELKKGILLTSSNSINISRWLSQQIYYAIGLAQWNQDEPPVVTVPSGNFGNLCAGLMASSSGLPVQQFIAACNANKVFTEFIDNGTFSPGSSIPTLSNAMDVGNPSNFNRIVELFAGSRDALLEKISSFSISDSSTESTISTVARESGYIMDPHTAVAHAAWEKWRGIYPGKAGIILGTAHPVKFPDIVEKATGKKIEIPENVAGIMHKEKKSTFIPADYQSLRSIIQGIKN